jgi:hypothetical protein
MGQKKLGFGLLVSGAALAAVGCGGGGGSPATGFTSAASLQSAMAHPTGTVSAETAVGVAAAFQDGSTTPLPAGVRSKTQAQSGSEPCTNGGAINYSANSNMVQMSFSNCAEGGCVSNGTYNMLISSATETEVSACFAMDISSVCASEGSASAQFSGCMEVNAETGSFEYNYLIEYEGETYTVSGNYSSGGGTLVITGANGSFTCTYAADAGSCTGSDGSSFEFTASSGSETVDG